MLGRLSLLWGVLGLVGCQDKSDQGAGNLAAGSAGESTGASTGSDTSTGVATGSPSSESSTAAPDFAPECFNAGQVGASLEGITHYDLRTCVITRVRGTREVTVKLDCVDEAGARPDSPKLRLGFLEDVSLPFSEGMNVELDAGEEWVFNWEGPTNLWYRISAEGEDLLVGADIAEFPEPPNRPELMGSFEVVAAPDELSCPPDVSMYCGEFSRIGLRVNVNGETAVVVEGERGEVSAYSVWVAAAERGERCDWYDYLVMKTR